MKRMARRHPQAGDVSGERPGADPLVPVEPVERVRWWRRRPGWVRTTLVVAPTLLGLVVTGMVGLSLLRSTGADPVEVVSDVSCWDGADPDDGCSTPEGGRGLRWVFPSFNPNRLDCVDDLVRNPSFNRPVMRTCEVMIGGRPVQVTYSEVTGQRPALRYFDQLHGEDRREPDVLGGAQVVRWRASPVPDGGWHASVLLKALPYAVTVRTERRSDADKVLRRWVDVRSQEELQLHR